MKPLERGLGGATLEANIAADLKVLGEEDEILKLDLSCWVAVKGLKLSYHNGYI